MRLTSQWCSASLGTENNIIINPESWQVTVSKASNRYSVTVSVTVSVSVSFNFKMEYRICHAGHTSHVSDVTK